MILNLKPCFQEVVEKMVLNHVHFHAIHIDFGWRGGGRGCFQMYCSSMT